MLKCQFKSLLRSKKVSSSLLTNHESQVLTLFKKITFLKNYTSVVDPSQNLKVEYKL